jgi:hypothetical protein
MPKVLENIITAAIITAAAPDPATHTVAVTWANGETTVNCFGHLVGKGVFRGLRRSGILCASARERGRA